MSAPVARLYSVQSQRVVRDVDPGGQAYDAVEISWAGPNNVAGRLRVPMSSFDAATVDGLIRDQVRKHLEVSNLGVTPVPPPPVAELTAQ